MLYHNPIQVLIHRTKNLLHIHLEFFHLYHSFLLSFHTANYQT